MARAQKLKVELEEKLFEVEAVVQDNLKEIALATEELENPKRALIPSAPTTDPGSACITLSREQSAELHRVLLSCQKSMANDPEGKERAKTKVRRRQVWSPTQTSIDNEPLLRTLQGSMGDKRGILILRRNRLRGA